MDRKIAVAVGIMGSALQRASMFSYYTLCSMLQNKGIFQISSVWIDFALLSAEKKNAALCALRK
jgi:hypothetical protein